jgi:methylglutaconyl-CoA hydratase
VTDGPEVRYEVADAVATITLDRPEQRNRLTAAGMRELTAALTRAAESDEVRVVVLTGSGTTFCAGADLAAVSTSDGFAGDGPALLVAALEALLDLPKPTIARVQGHVAGGGNGLVAACDLAVASSEARFAFSEVRVGVAPAVISVTCLAVMDRRSSQELLLTGERVDAQRALAAGLLTRVVEPERLDAEVDGLAKALLAGGPQALARTKDLLRRVPVLSRDEAFALTAGLSAEAFSSDEAREGMTAFLERRPASWVPQG